MTQRLLIIDDEPKIRRAFEGLLRDEGYLTDTAGSVDEGRRALGRDVFDLVLLDLSFPGESGLDLLRGGLTAGVPPVLVISGQSEISTALEAIKLGALDYLEKPVPPERLLTSVRAALMISRANHQQEAVALESESHQPLLGDSPIMKRLLRTVDQAALSDATVLITGSNGTGKELVATRLHLMSERRTGPLIKVNCPGIPETLFESELFGHRKGAFTGAVSDYPGKFVMADGGTLFLDEIGDLPLISQAKLLRVLETREIEALGAEKLRKVDIRVVCATNRDLPTLVSQEKFRQDLFYRISVLEIECPALSERPDDIPTLVGHFIGKCSGDRDFQISPEAMAYLANLEYRGNVRQLKNVIERLTIIYPGRKIGLAEVAAQTGSSPETISKEPSEAMSLSERVHQYERQLVKATLEQCQGNLSAAARQLNTDRANLSRKVTQYDLRKH